MALDGLIETNSALAIFDEAFRDVEAHHREQAS